MATVTGLTAARMIEIEDASVVSGEIDGLGHLILTTHGGDEIDAGYILGSVPDASDTVKGIVELATSAETTARSDTTRAVTPAGLAATYNDLDGRLDTLEAAGSGFFSDLNLISLADRQMLQFDNATGKWVNVTSLELNGYTRVTRGLATNGAFAARITGDVEDRALILSDGTILLGGGAVAQDVDIFRSAANVLKTNDHFIAALGVTVKTVEIDPASPATGHILRYNGTKYVSVAEQSVAFPNARGIKGTNATSTAGCTTSYTNMGASSFNFTKRYTTTLLRISASGTFYTTNAANGIIVGIRINSVDYDVAKMPPTMAANEHVPYVGFDYIAASIVPAGAYTIQGRWKAINGATIISDSVDTYMFEVEEVSS